MAQINYRTEQDNDISLYSLDELKAMYRKYQSNSTTWQPFTFKEVNFEIRKRQGKPAFLQEWTEAQFKAIEKAIAKHFSGQIVTTNKGRYPRTVYTWAAISNLLGLAYTSSSSYAGYWPCNEDAINNHYQTHKYIGFAISEDQKYYAILWDKEENEILIEL